MFHSIDGVLLCHTSAVTVASKVSLGPSNTLVFHGQKLSALYLCPQADPTVWAVYVRPSSTHGRCVATSLHVSEFEDQHGARNSSVNHVSARRRGIQPSVKIYTVTENVTETVTLIETSTTNCRLGHRPSLTPREAGLSSQT